MKSFDGRSSVEEYTSTHSLGFSTPDLMLKEFVLWLCEKVNDPNGKENIPRILLYLKGEANGKSIKDSSKASLPKMVNPTTEPKIFASNKPTGITESKFCIECGLKLNLRSKFCIRCGTEQVES